jgi:hypothetical protein
MRTLLLLIMVAGLSLPGRAAELLEGYIVTTGNDTTKCQFKTGGVVTYTNFFNKLTVVKPGGEEQVFHARDKELVAFGVIRDGRWYHYLFVDARPSADRGFYQRLVGGPKYNLYGRMIGSAAPGINVSSPLYVLFNPAGAFVKFETCALCPWRKLLRGLFAADAAALQALEQMPLPPDIPKLVQEINRN